MLYPARDREGRMARRDHAYQQPLWHPDDSHVAMPMAPPVTLPAHCELTGAMQERIGVDGQHYAIRFHLRLPLRWNGKFLFEGGGGTEGDLGSAIGATTPGAPPAIAQGYAVVSQDSGHDNATNSVPSRGGNVAFGFDPEARANYGGASLRLVAQTAKAIIHSYYGRLPQHSYFLGCSKGGQEGMVFAQRFPDEFDGIVAGAPGFSLPRAAVAEAWDTQAFGNLVTHTGVPRASTPSCFRRASVMRSSESHATRSWLRAMPTTERRTALRRRSRLARGDGS